MTAISGIGTRFAARLGDLGITTVADLAAADHHELARRFGPTIGPYLRLLGLGGDDSPVVDEPHVPRSRSREVTFEHDLTDPADVAANVVRLAEEVTASVADLGRRITHVAVKVRTATFFTRSKPASSPSRRATPPSSSTRPSPCSPASRAAARSASSAFVSTSRTRLTGSQPVRPIGQLTPVPPMPQ